METPEWNGIAGVDSVYLSKNVRKRIKKHMESGR